MQKTKMDTTIDREEELISTIFGSASVNMDSANQANVLLMANTEFMHHKRHKIGR